MDAIRMLALAGTIAAGLLGGLYAGAQPDEPSEVLVIRSVASDPLPPEASSVGASPATPTAPSATELPEGREPSPEVVELAASLEAIVDPQTGVSLGPFTLRPAPEPEPEAEASPTTEPRRAARRARRPAPPPMPRLHPDPGRHVIAVARRMNANGERIRGSCYRYLEEVYTRAGHAGWRNRRVVYNEGRNGPYANLDLIRPGDWLYIVNHPHRTPVGTHSVLFVGWQDRARGYARVIEHPGWGAPTTGRERGYDVSRTYRITRPVLPGS